MSEDACLAIEDAWQLTIKARALCPIPNDLMIGSMGYISPPWYQEHGAIYSVFLAEPLTAEGAEEFRRIGNFVNRSFIISMVAILQEYDIVSYHTMPTPDRDGSKHVKLAIWLRNRFGHGEWKYNPSKKTHKETRELLEKLFPGPASEGV